MDSNRPDAKYTGTHIKKQCISQTIPHKLSALCVPKDSSVIKVNIGRFVDNLEILVSFFINQLTVFLTYGVKLAAKDAPGWPLVHLFVRYRIAQKGWK